MSIEVADVAPDFTLRDQHGQDVSLADFRDRRQVLLVFYPYAFTGTCQGELDAIRDDLPRWQNDAVQVLTVSVDSPFAHRVWAERDGFTFPLLADFWPHGAVARAYGVLDERLGAAVRGTFLIDPGGVVRWKVVTGLGEARDHAAVLAAVADLGGERVPGR
jgi:peroxiredoxin